MIEYRPFHRDDITPIISKIRPIDEKECVLFFEKTPRLVLKESAIFSDEAWTVTASGIPIAVMGYGELEWMTAQGCFWFLGTESVKDHRRSFLKDPPLFFERAFTRYSTLSNYVIEENKEALRFMRYHGFKEDKDKYKVKNNATFVFMEKKR